MIAVRLLPALVLLALSLAAPGVHAQVASQVVDSEDQVTRQRLASTCIRFAREVVGTEPLSVQAIQAARDFLIDAVTLDPQSASGWRMLVDLAKVLDDEVLLNEAVRQLLSIEPDNSVARLERFLDVLDQLGHIDDQDAMIRQLLEPANIHVVGMDVGSRLAQRLASLNRRAGDLEGYQRWLWEAVRLDPSNVEARAMQAGLSAHLAQSDPMLWTHVLVGLYEATLVDSAAATELGFFLLDHGVYGEAARMLELARGMSMASGVDAGADLDADLALALWAEGDDDGAMEVIQDRIATIDATFRQILQSEGVASGRDDVLEVARLRAPLPPKLAAVRAMVFFEHGDLSELRDAIDDVVRATDELDRILEEQGAAPEVRASSLRRLLWLLVMLDASEGQIDDIAAQIDRLTPMSDEERALLDIARGTVNVEVEAAIRRDLRMAPVAGVILADGLEAQGRRRDAAEMYLSVHRGGYGTIVGAYAGHRLEDLLGETVPLDATGHAMAQAMNDLSKTLSRLPLEPTLGASLQVEPVKKTVEPYDPILMEIEVFNHLHRSVAVSEHGPLRDLILVSPKLAIPHRPLAADITLLIPLSRALHIPPNDSLVITIDLRETWVGSALDLTPLRGGAVDIEATLNPRVATAPTSGSASHLAGALGSEMRSEATRVDGVRVTDAWVERVTDGLGDSQGAADLVNWALLSHAIASQDERESPVVLVDGAQAAAEAAMVEAWPGLDLVSQVWLATTLAESDRIDDLWSLVDDSTDSLITRVRLMRVVKSYTSPGEALDDPVVIKGLASEVESVRVLAEWIEATLQIQAESRYGDAFK